MSQAQSNGYTKFADPAGEDGRELHWDRSKSGSKNCNGAQDTTGKKGDPEEKTKALCSTTSSTARQGGAMTRSEGKGSRPSDPVQELEIDQFESEKKKNG